MTPEVKSLGEAKDWFLNHADGGVWCVRDDGADGAWCDSYPEAETFYKKN